jgi:CHAT domain-containing protein
VIRRLLLAAAAALLLAGPAPAGDPPAVPRNRAAENVERFLVAWRAKDDAGMAYVRLEPVSPNWDPFILANELFQRHVEGSLREPPAPGDFLAAARALAERVRDIRANATLPALVERWAAMGIEDLRREAALYRNYLRSAGASAAGREDERLAILLEARAASGGWPSVTAVCCRNRLADLRGERGETRESVEAWREASGLARAIGWTSEEAGDLWQAGYLHYRRGNLPAARAIWEEELVIIEARGHPEWRADTLCWIGAARAGLGDLEGGMALVARAAEEARKAGIAIREGAALETLGRLNGQIGRYARALECLEGARAKYLSVEDRARVGLASARQATGSIYMELGRPRDAADALREAVAVLEGHGYLEQANRARSELGAALEALGEHGEALAIQEKALVTWEGYHDVLGATRTRERLGDLHFAAGRLADAREVREKALAAYESMGNRPGAARMRAALGEVLAAAGEADGAREQLDRAFGEARALGDVRLAARAMVAIAGIERASSRNSDALSLAGRAVDGLVTLGWGLGEEDAPGLRREVRAAADLGVLAAAAVAAAHPDGAPGAAAEAFRLAEAGRGFLLAEGIVNREALLAAGIPEALRDEESAARGRVAAARVSLADLVSRTGAEPAAVQAARAEFDAAYKALGESVGRIQREARRVAAVVYPQPVSIEELRGALGPTDAAVLFHLTPSRAFAIVATGEAIRLFDLGESAPLAAAAEEWLDLVSVSGSDDEGLAAALYDALLRPLEGALAGKTRLLVSPDGVLAFLPLEALLRLDVPKRERVVERWEVVYVPSATVFAARTPEDAAPGTGILAVGDPVYPGEGGAVAPAGSGDAGVLRTGFLRRLPGTAEEVRAIADLAPPERRTLLVRERATRANLDGALADAKGRLAALHFACHGRVDPERPRLTGLVLSGGEVLSLDDVYRMRVPADLVVLSACETGRGRLLEGEGVMGLARGFFFAGARRVVVSDWAVSDRATRTLMTEFYRGLLREGLPPGRALRAAKIAALRAGDASSHPADWAAFVLWGAGRD